MKLSSLQLDPVGNANVCMDQYAICVSQGDSERCDCNAYFMQAIRYVSSFPSSARFLCQGASCMDVQEFNVDKLYH